MYKSFYCFILSCIIINLTAQDIQIIDASDLKPIPNVLIHNSDYSFSLVSDDLGIIRCVELNKDDTIHIKHSSYYSVSYSLDSLKSIGYIIPLNEKVISIGAFVFYSNKYTNKANEIPHMIQQIQAHDFELDHPMNNADILMKQGQVFVQKSQMGGGSPVIRGFEANKVLLMLDGIKMNNAIFRSGHVHNLIQVDPYSISSTEIIFGPGSVMHGSDALGGVINISTKKPLFSNDSSYWNINTISKFLSANNGKVFHANLRYSSTNHAWIINYTKSEFGDIKSGKQRNVIYPDFGSYPYYHSFINGKDSTITNDKHWVQRNTAYTQSNLHIKHAYRWEDNYLESGFLYANSSDIPRFDRLNDYSNGNMHYARWDYGPYNYKLAYLKLKIYTGIPLFEMPNITIAYQRVNEDRITRKFNNPLELHRNEDLDIYSFSMDFNKEISDAHSIFYGFDADLNIIKSSAWSNNIYDLSTNKISTRYPDGGSWQSDNGIFCYYQFKPNNKVNISLGQRLSQRNLYSSLMDTSFFNFSFNEIRMNNLAYTFNTSLIHKLNNELSYKLMFASGFRAPNLDDVTKVFDSKPGNVVVPNNQLKPEYANNLELGIEKTINERLYFNLAFYHTWVDNIIIRSNFEHNGSDSIIYDGVLSQVEAQINGEKSIIKGFSIQLSAEVNDHLAYKTSINLTKGYEVLNKTPLSHIPPLFGTTRLIWKSSNYSIEFLSSYNGWKFIDEYGFGSTDRKEEATIDGTPSWIVFDLSSNLKINRHLELQLGVQNLFDKHYKAFSSGISGPGRNYVFGVKANF